MGDSQHVWLDPDIIYFTHAKVSRSFSGCGRRINDTILEITEGRTSIDQIPTITVLQCGNKSDNNNAFFTLNNRRLYVFKHLRSVGFLEQFDNKVKVRLKVAKKRELERYSVKRCSLTATFMGQQEEIGEAQIDAWDGFLCREEDVDEDSKDDSDPNCIKDNDTQSGAVSISKKKVTYNDLSEKTKKEYSKILGLAQKGKVKDICKLLDSLVAQSELSKDHRTFIEKELEVL